VELRDASLLDRTPVDRVGDAERDATIAAALDALPANVVPLRRRIAPRWLGIAAAVLVVAVGAVTLSHRGDDHPADTASKAAGDSTASGAANTLAAPSEAFDTAVATVDAGDLGELEGADLRASVDGALGAQRQTAAAPRAAAGTNPVTPCEDAIRAGNPDLGPLVVRANGTFAGEAVELLAFDLGDRRRIYVAAVEGCGIRNQTTYAL
jgi:hypothetical protein